MGPRHFLKQNDYNFKRAESGSEKKIFVRNKKPISLQAKLPHQEGLRIQSRNIPVETRIPIEKESHQAIHKMFSLLAHRLMGFLFKKYLNFRYLNYSTFLVFCQIYKCKRE